MTGIKTTEKNHLYTVQKRVGKRWERIVDAIFVKRANARECAKELNNVTRSAKNTLPRYRVARMEIVAQKP